MPQSVPMGFIPTFLVISVVVMLIGVILIVGFHEIPKDNVELFTSLASGGIGSAFGAIMGFIFGSSQGSKNKDDTINAVAAKVAE